MIPGYKAKEVRIQVVDVPSPAAPASSGRAVLLVDEALPVRRKLEDILLRSGFAADEVHAVENADQVMPTFRATRPSLVLAELVGDDPESGLDLVLEMLRADPTVKIVLVTAEAADSPLVRQAVRYGVFAVVQKPLRHEKIRQVLQELSSEEGGIERLR